MDVQAAAEKKSRSQEVFDLPNILNRGEFRRLRLDEPRKVVPLSEGAPGHDESQSTSEAQIPVDRRCFV